MQKKPYAGKHQPCTCGRFVPALFPGQAPRVCCFSPGANMMAIIVKVAAGKRPGLELVRDDWPGECHQMLDLMKRCWDQDPKQRPSFAGGTGLWIIPRQAGRIAQGCAHFSQLHLRGLTAWRPLLSPIPSIPAFPRVPAWLCRLAQLAQLHCSALQISLWRQTCCWL